MPPIFCARTLCGTVASAILFINARELTAQLVDLDSTSSGGGVPLCKSHADAVVVPQGWELRDLRTPAFEPEFDLDPKAAPAITTVSSANADVANTEPELTSDLPVLEETASQADPTPNKEATPLLNRAFRAAGLN